MSNSVKGFFGMFFCAATMLSQPAQQFQLGRGSGFLVTAQGHLVTNAHVIKECDAVEVFIKGRTYDASVKAVDSQNDLALLLLKETPGTFLGFREQRTRLGENVVAMGYPLQGIGATSISITSGTISVLAGLKDDTRMVQFTAPVQPGNSGGPLVDASGRIVGVVASKLSALWSAENIGDIPQNVNFAIRDSVVRAFLESRSIEYNTVAAGAMDLTVLAERVERAVGRVDCSSNQTSRLGSSNSVPREKRRGVLLSGYGAPGEFFQSVFLELQNVLAVYGVQVANRPAEMRAVTDDSFSLPNRLEAVRVAGADSLLYITIEHSGMNILRVRLRCFDPEGKLLWEETGSNARMLFGDERSSVPVVMKQLKAKLKPYVGKPGLPLR